MGLTRWINEFPGQPSSLVRSFVLSVSFVCSFLFLPLCFPLSSSLLLFLPYSLFLTPYSSLLTPKLQAPSSKLQAPYKLEYSQIESYPYLLYLQGYPRRVYTSIQLTIRLSMYL